MQKLHTYAELADVLRVN